eukprot:15341748-Ditylum_brightwellii.AAC.1
MISTNGTYTDVDIDKTERKQTKVNVIVFTRAGHLIISTLFVYQQCNILRKALEQVLLRDGMRVGDKYFDVWRQRSNISLDGNMSYLMTDHASKLPPLSK